MPVAKTDGPVQLVWFKRDLRITDHAALAEAAARGPVIPLFVAEPDLWRGPDMSARQWAFVRECLRELRASLAALGQPLVVRTGSVIGWLSEIHTSHRIDTLWSHQETGNHRTFKRDKAVRAWCRDNGVPWREGRQDGVIRRIEGRDGWAKRWDRFMAQDLTAPPLALQTLGNIDPGNIPSADDLRLDSDHCPERQAGGRQSGHACLSSFLTERGETYRTAMSSPASGFTACSRLSPHLAWGTVSMREVAQATWQRQSELKRLPRAAAGSWPGAITSFSGRLHWRSHFMQKLEDEPALEFRNFHRAYDGIRPDDADGNHYGAWARGETGLPFVDACMRCLHATGWMNFRMRAMLMAVASYHLWLDWRKPGEHLARLFTDYEPGIHWPQVQMQSGTTGINTIRIYNPVKQGHDQDADGRFVRKWVPELTAVPDRFIHEPWKWEDTGTILGKRYPLPIIDHLEAARDARQKIWAVRRGNEFRDEANRIQNKHGSRKSGVPATGRKRKAESGGQQFALKFPPGQKDGK